MRQCNYKIAVIIVFFGKWPEWIHHFLNICNQRYELHFLIFSDNELGKRFNNVSLHKLNLVDITSLIKQKIDININLTDAYKLCDFKPTFGKLFEDYLKGYDFWAYSDIDLFYGNLFDSGIYAYFEENDVVSLYSGFASGPLCFYRNRPNINELFRQVKDYRNRLEATTYQGFDEHIVKQENVGYSITKCRLFLKFLPKFLMHTPSIKRTINQLKYDFQWFVKKHTLKEPADISEAIFLNTYQGRIKSKFFNALTNDADYYRNKIDNWELEYKDGELYDSENQQHTVFHIIESKNLQSFKVDKSKSKTTHFKINRHGIQEL